MSQTAGPNIHLGFISRLESIRIRINENEDQNQDCNGIRTRMKTKIGIILLLRRRITISEGSELLQRSICWFDPAPCSTFPGAFVQQGFHWFHPTLFVQQPHMCTEQNSHWFSQTLFRINSFLAGGDHQGDFYKKCFWENLGAPNFSKWFLVRSVTFGLSMGGGLKMHIWWRPTPM